MESAQSASHGKHKQRVGGTEEADDVALGRALSMLKTYTELHDQKVARKALETFETSLRPSLRYQPAAISTTTKVGSHAYTGQQTRKFSRRQDVSEVSNKTPITKQEELHDHSVTSSFQSLSTYDDDGTDVEPEMYDDKPQYLGKPGSFEIGNEKAVLEFVMDRCKLLQQVPMKKIAKLWIRGICPRKQAVFPYSCNKGGTTQKDERQPLWWPANNCKFKEPDHVGRDERNHLCIHLLRLRPTAEQLRDWNGEKMVPNEIHATQGWTKFLASLAPVSCLDELREKNKDKAARRRVLLQQLYDVAQMEEDYRDGGRDATDIFHYTDPVGPITRSKRLRTPRGIAKGNSMSSTVSLDKNPTSAKRQRRLPAEDKPCVDDEVVAIDVDAMEIDPKLCLATDNKPHTGLDAMSPSRAAVFSTTATSRQEMGEPKHDIQQHEAKAEPPWQTLRGVAPDPGCRQHEALYTPRPVRPPVVIPYENDSWTPYVHGPAMVPPFPPREISVYRVGGPPQPQFGPTPGQQFLPFNEPMPASNMAGLPAFEHELGAFTMQQYPAAPMPSPASAGPSPSFAGFYDYQHPPMAHEQVHDGWWTYPADTSTAWPAGLPELTNECNQPFR